MKSTNYQKINLVMQNNVIIRFKMLFSALIILVLLLSANGQAGTVHERSFKPENITRNYLLYVPSSYTGQEAWPLIINYHGFNSSSESQMNRVSLMNFRADTANFLIAYPEGLFVTSRVLGSTNRGWNVLGSYIANQNDITFTDKMIDHIIADYNIDLARIHATGWSNGGEMAFYVASELPDRIASVASVANAMNTTLMDAFKIERPFSMMLIHGTADPIFPYTGIDGYYLQPPATTSFWAKHNGCISDSIVMELPDKSSYDSSTVTIIRYIECYNNAEVLYYRVNNGGHAWPGGPPITSLGNTNYDINAGSEIWNFFKRNPHPNAPTGLATKKVNSLKSFNLSQNHPNPFNPETKIEYHLPKADYVELTVFDISGREITTLVNKHQNAGAHTVSFNGTNLSSGIYFFKIVTSSGYEQSRKMTLLK